MINKPTIYTDPQFERFPLAPLFDYPKPNDMCGWYYFEKAFSDDDIKRVEEMVSSIPFEAARIENGLSEEYRKSSLKWITPFDSNLWLYEKLMDLIQTANIAMWNFDLHSVRDNIQYTEYRGEEKGFYDWHLDIGSNQLSTRKISITVQLSDPSEYEGGNLELKPGEDAHHPSKTKGTVVVFPSYLLHRVTPVTKGLRKSLVLWSGGSSYK
tara:strand:+ start:3458 stop:4090 length:633 start_codon:yes stop_codon:yes gene_type:complete